MPLDPGPETRCMCGAKMVRQNTAELIGDVVHRVDQYCYNMNQPQRALTSPGQNVLAKYVGTEHGPPFRKGETYTLKVVDMSVFDDDLRVWYTYKSLEQFFKSWVVVV